MRGGHHGDLVRRHVHAALRELRGDPGEVLQDVVRGKVRDAEVHARRLVPSLARGLDLAVDGARDDVARRELQPLVVPLHEPLARGVEQPTAVASHRLGDEERVLVLAPLRRAARAGVQRRRVELIKLHVGHVGARAHRHRHAVSRGHPRVGRAREELPSAAAREHRRAGDEARPRAAPAVDDLRADALERPVSRLRRDQIRRDVKLVKRHARVRPRALQQRALDLLPGHVRRVHDPVLRVASLAREV
mmetsp:Transcript_4659/g.16578  ORF Transcript_4659/g.16578 Transcript_4659/m.16578 type:complete len:248 (+) Transcript_4659:848-1591(+)